MLTPCGAVFSIRVFSLSAAPSFESDRTNKKSKSFVPELIAATQNSEASKSSFSPHHFRESESIANMLLLMRPTSSILLSSCHISVFCVMTAMRSEYELLRAIANALSGTAEKTDVPLCWLLRIRYEVISPAKSTRQTAKNIIIVFLIYSYLVYILIIQIYFPK